MEIMLVSTQDYIHHPVPSRHHYIFEEISKKHTVHVPHFHVSGNNVERKTNLVVHEATQFPVKNPFLHYTLNAPRHFAVMKKIIKENGIDIVVASNVLAGTAAIRAAQKYNIPVIFDLKDWFPTSAAAYIRTPIGKKIVHDAVLAITRYNLKHSDKITTVSSNLVKEINNLGFEAECIPNGVNTDYFYSFDSSEIRKRYGISENDIVIGFSGSIERWYSINKLIDYTYKIKKNLNENVKLMVVGPSLFTGYDEELKQQVKNLGMEDSVIFTGGVRYEELPRYINAMDITTIPLETDHWINIAYPNKYFEYSACGKIIFSKPIPSLTEEFIPNVFIYSNFLDFIELFREFVNYRNGLQNGKHNIYKTDASQFDWRNRVARFEEIMEELIIKYKKS